MNDQLHLESSLVRDNAKYKEGIDSDIRQFLESVILYRIRCSVSSENIFTDIIDNFMMLHCFTSASRISNINFTDWLMMDGFSSEDFVVTLSCLVQMELYGKHLCSGVILLCL